MKIMTQSRQGLIDITGADIFLDCDEEWYFVMLVKGKMKCMLGQYSDVTTAKNELSNIFRYIREKKSCYCMSS